MTPSRYLFFRIASRFGYTRKNVRLGNAATESHLLKEAETFLGQAIWRKVENIEELSMEYWNLRKLFKEYEQISKETNQLQDKLSESHLHHSETWKNANESLTDLIEEKRQIFVNLDALTRARDRIVAKAKEVRRQFEGLKIKQQVLAKEGNKLSEIEKTSQRLNEIRADFDKLKLERDAIAEQIAVANARIKEIDVLVSERKEDGKSKAAGSSQYLGDTNQQISAQRAQLNSLGTQMSQLYAEIGRFVSVNYSTNPACKQAGREHRGLIDVMAALRRSIQYNLKLGGYA